MSILISEIVKTRSTILARGNVLVDSIYWLDDISDTFLLFLFQTTSKSILTISNALTCFSHSENRFSCVNSECKVNELTFSPHAIQSETFCFYQHCAIDTAAECNSAPVQLNSN